MEMEKKLEKISLSAACPVRNVLDRIGDKWSILVMMILNEGETFRFNELQKIIGDISQKMLTVTLRSLEADGLISRKVYPEVPPRVEYRLTDMGNSLIPHINNLVQWADEYMETITATRQRYGS
tara:strand:- start:685 stop:1056 length:372 start_codon:yes stop_codon:yes gene_type:complete